MTLKRLNGLAIPILPSRDLDETLHFYAWLGFACVFRQDQPDGYAIVRRDEVELHFFWHPTIDPAQNDAGCYLRLDDVQSLYEEYWSTGIPGLHALEDKPWGMREFALIDPSGCLLRIGQAIAQG